jgi:chromosome segregation ATPase
VTLLLKQSLLIPNTDYLQDQLNIRNIEANIMGEHIHGLELKLTELEKFPERVRVMDNDLMRSDSQCWLLMEEVQRKEEELQKAALQIEKLESVTLDSQCEIESLKLDLTTLEQRLFDAESFGQHAADDKARMEKQLREYELQMQEARKTIDRLEIENTQLKKEFLPRRAPIQSSSTTVEQLEKTLENDGHANYERGHEVLEKMGKQNEEPELLIEQLKVRVRLQHLLQPFVLYYQTSLKINYFKILLLLALLFG